MEARRFDIAPHEMDERKGLQAPGQTLSTDELLAIMSGELEGHKWTIVDTGEIYREGTVRPGDAETWVQYSRQTLAERHDCQYGGMIKPEEARARYRAALWQVWENLYNQD